MYAANEENKSFEANNDLAEMTVPKDKRIKIDVLLNDYGDKLKIRKVWGAKHGSAWESGSKNYISAQLGFCRRRFFQI